MTQRNIASPTLERRISVITLAITLAFLAMASMIAAVYAATPAEVQKARHDRYEELGDAFKVVRDNSKGSPDYAALQKAVAVIEKASVDQVHWFPKGSGPEAGKTRAMPEIWTKPTEFAAAQKMFSDRVPALSAAVKAQDVDAIAKAFRELGGSCKNCHDNFRAPE